MQKKLKRSSFLVITIAIALLVFNLYKLRNEQTHHLEQSYTNDSPKEEIFVSILLLASGVFLFKRAKYFKN